MEVDPRTHLGINQRLCGEPVELEEDRAVVELATTEEMAVDDRGLVHGGFVFGAADYAAMLAVNDPNVVLGGATSRFLAPVQVGERLEATAAVTERDGKKVTVEATARVDEGSVFEASFTTFVLESHVLADD